LNINRPGYAGNALPSTSTPIKDSIPLYISLIKKVYAEYSNGRRGVVLVGHSLGALTSLCIAAYGGDELPLLGVSALGIIPTKEHSKALIEILKSSGERFVVEASPETIETFMGPDEFINFESVGQPGIELIFEPGVYPLLLDRCLLR